MRVLVACEYSGVVRDAFRRAGHDAVSCDVIPTEAPGPHIQDDVLLHLDEGWDLMIAHPPCTYLCSSGLFWNRRRPERAVQTHDAMIFVFALMDAAIPHIALENPIGCISTNFRKPDQIIQPWWFGHEESKSTCLWLKNLPCLVPTKLVAESYSCRCGHNFALDLGKYGCPNCNGTSPVVKGHGHKVITKGGKVLPKWYNLPPSESRGKERSRTFQGIADAMASQWGGVA